MGARRRRGPTRKNRAEIELMRAAGRIVALALKRVAAAAAPGVSTKQLDRIAEETIRGEGAEPCFMGQRLGNLVYPATICASINDAVVHGIPSDEVVLHEGDIVGVDVGARLDGYHGDSAITVMIGEVAPEVRRLVEVTQASLMAGIRAARSGNVVGDISRAVQEYVEAQGFSVVLDLVGHGIGREMWEPPNVPNFIRPSHPDHSVALLPGMALAIEPMINAGGSAVRTDRDGWTVRTVDGLPSAHFEHSIAITKGEPIILTQCEEDA